MQATSTPAEPAPETLDHARWVAGLPDRVLIPATLADFECKHGLLEDCADCHAEPELVAGNA